MLRSSLNNGHDLGVMPQQKNATYGEDKTKPSQNFYLKFAKEAFDNRDTGAEPDQKLSYYVTNVFFLRKSDGYRRAF